jgi:hypothetical protein
MADSVGAQQQKSGKPWSGANKIPNIKEFVANLDKEKAQRDKAFEADPNQSQTNTPEVTPHQNEKPKTKGKTVTDPVTGNQVVIADVGKEYMKRADNPVVSAKAAASLSSFKLTMVFSYPFPMPTWESQHAFRPIPVRRTQSIKRSKTSQLLQIPSPKGAPRMCLFMVKRPMSCSTPHLRLAMSLCLLCSNSVQVVSVLQSWFRSLLWGRCLVAPSKV